MSGDPVDRLFAGIVLHAAVNRGATRQELIDLAVKYGRLDVVGHLLRNLSPPSVEADR